MTVKFMDREASAKCMNLNLHALREKQFVATGLFLGVAGIGAAPTVACSGSNTAAAPTNGTVGAAGNTSRPYKCVDL